MLENASNCRVEGCHFENIGGYALWLHLDSQKNVIDGNTVLNSGGGGVLMTGSRLSYMDDTKVYTPGTAAAQVAPILNEVTHNTVKHCGKIRYYGGGVHMDSRPASMAMMPGNYIAHNHFQDLSRNGIFAFRNQGGNVVEYNQIHDCMQTTIDGACIHFATMNRLNAPNHILSNYLYDIWGFEQLLGGNPKRKLANGVFLDWDTSNTTIKHNYIYNAGGQPVKTIWNNRGLSVDDNHSADGRIEPPFLGEVGPWGTATHGIRPADLRRTGRVLHYMEKDFVAVEGDWQPETVVGLSGLFRFSFIKARPGAIAKATFRLPIEEPGSYLLCLCYKPDKDNASNALLKVTHVEGEDIRAWSLRQGNEHGFAVEVGTYRFDPKEPALLTISNEGSDGFVVADSVAFVKNQER
ncbi:MAG: right-handed parallel beta-helix repeat-containing protein [Proteobacteria bacterium]|nr:right-handed parallel beta-helix repeat-containing protein [Pseudomonadota bacterium]